MRRSVVTPAAPGQAARSLTGHRELSRSSGCRSISVGFSRRLITKHARQLRVTFPFQTSGIFFSTLAWIVMESSAVPFGTPTVIPLTRTKRGEQNYECGWKLNQVWSCLHCSLLPDKLVEYLLFCQTQVSSTIFDASAILIYNVLDRLLLVTPQRLFIRGHEYARNYSAIGFSCIPPQIFMQIFERPARMPKFPHFYESLAFEFIAMHFIRGLGCWAD